MIHMSLISLPIYIRTQFRLTYTITDRQRSTWKLTMLPMALRQTLTDSPAFTVTQKNKKGKVIACLWCAWSCKPEKKAIMEHFNITFLSTYQSASESKLKVLEGSIGPLIQHRWTLTFGYMYYYWCCFHVQNTIGAPQPRYVCMAATKTQEQFTKVQHIFLPRGSSITALTMKTITT